MTKFVSEYAGDLILPGGEKIAPGQEGVELGPDMLKNAAVQGWLKDRWLVPETAILAARQAEAEAQAEATQIAAEAARAQADNLSNQADPITRESLADMDKPALIELLEAHGADPDGRHGEEKLREQAEQVLFVNL